MAMEVWEDVIQHLKLLLGEDIVQQLPNEDNHNQLQKGKVSKTELI